MVDFLEKEAANLEDYKELLSTPSIKLWIKWGSIFDDKQPLLKGRFDFGPSIDPDLFIKLLVDERTSWDSNLMEATDLEILTPDVSIVHYVHKAPIFLMKPRDLAEKKIRFKQNNSYYAYHGSVPESIYPCPSKYQRCETIFSGNILRKEGDAYIYYTFSQMNLNVFL